MTNAYTGWYVTGNYSVSTATTLTISPSDYAWGGGGRWLDEQDGKLVAPKGRDIKLPDGTIVKVDDLGNFKIEDKDAKVVYQAQRMREFNPFVNASDLLSSFIRDVGALGITREELSKLPIPLFINWLVIKAAERDHDPIPDDVTPLAQHPMIQRLLPARVA